MINFSKEYAHAVVEVGVADDSNLAKASGESSLLVRTVTRGQPGPHMQVALLFRKMIKDNFDREGIEIPSARQVLIFKNQPETPCGPPPRTSLLFAG